MFFENVDSRSLHGTRSERQNLVQTLLDCLKNKACSGRLSDPEAREKGTTHRRHNIKKSHWTPEYTVYRNAFIYTVDNDRYDDWTQNPQQALVIDFDHGVIEYIGNEAGAKYYIDNYDCDVHDLKGQTIFPGFHDVHTHPLEAGSSLGANCQLDGDSSPTDLQGSIKECADNQKKEIHEWVLGKGYYITEVLKYISKPDSKPPRIILDEIIPDRPVVMMEQTSHSVWVNTEALQRAGIDEYTPNPVGGVIMREKHSKKPNGILLENQGNLMMDLALDSTKYSAVHKANVKAITDSIEFFFPSNGITSAVDSRTYWLRGHLKAYEALLKEYEGNIPVRMILALWAYPHMPLQDLKDGLMDTKHTYSYLESLKHHRFKMGQIKVYSDGLLESTTAKLFEPYDIDIDLPGIVGNKGMNYFDETKLGDTIGELQKYFDFQIHAIGGKAVHESLNAIQRNWKQGHDNRHRLTHVELVTNGDLNRFAALGVIADPQVAGNFTLPDYINSEIKDVIGRERTKEFIRLNDLVNTKAHVTLSSDWDVSPLNPWLGVGHAINRGDQSVSMKTAIELYTINGAYVMRQEKDTGSLVVGKFADLVIVDNNIFGKDFMWQKVNQTKVMKTILQGKVTYDPWYK